MKGRNGTAFEKFRSGLEDAIAFHRGDRTLTVRDVELRPPTRFSGKDVASLRRRLRVSQAALARLLNVSPRTVQAWESNARTPSDAALKLLHVASRHPEVLLEV
jgi:putative transcriptional regulator